MKRIFILLIITGVSLLFVFIGSVITADQTKYNNSFTRVFPPHFINEEAVLRLQPGRFSLAGVDDNHIFLRDRSQRSGVIIINPELTDTTFIPVKINSEILVDNPYFFLYDGSNPSIQRGSIKDWTLDSSFNKIPGFTLMQPVSKNTAVLRTVDSRQLKSIFVRSDQPNTSKDLLTKQVDGILCTDGYLQFSKEYNRLIYTYRYRNQLLFIDTLLNILFTGKTIDTTSVAKISVAEVNGEIKMSRPPLVVNKSTCVSGRYLFVNSNLTAKNESSERSRTNSAIDIYDVLDGHYVSSFYIENQNGARMQSFLVTKNKIIALFPDRIIQYKF
jgi:hypothetical protein